MWLLSSRQRLSLLWPAMAILTIYCVRVVISKPMEGGGNDDVINMEVGQDTPTDDVIQEPQENGWNSEQTDGQVPDQGVDSHADDQQAVDTEGEGQGETAQTAGHLVREEQEIDWGHVAEDEQWSNDGQQQEQFDQQNQEQQQQQYQEQQYEEQQQQQQQQGQEEQHQEQYQQGVGVVNPEEVMHDDDGHAHDRAQEVVDPNSEEARQEAARQAELRQAAEAEELQEARPNLVTNVHDNKARTAAEFMKDRQFGPNDVEELMHGGHHVHGEEGESGRGAIQAGNLDSLTQGGGKQGSPLDGKVHLTLDPEQLMHADEGHDPEHNPHHHQGAESMPGAESPEDLVFKSNTVKENTKTVVVDKDSIGPTFEGAVHGEEHVHTGERGKQAGKKVRYQDIIDLGLSQEALKGIDLSKLLEQEQREFDQWQQDAREQADSEEIGDGTHEHDPVYWQKQVTNLRQQYMEKLYAKVKEISPPDLDTAEWEDEWELHHDGESRVEHEMEMWASTVAKGDRKPYKMMRQGREGDMEGEQGHGEEGADEERHEGDGFGVGEDEEGEDL